MVNGYFGSLFTEVNEGNEGPSPAREARDFVFFVDFCSERRTGSTAASRRPWSVLERGRFGSSNLVYARGCHGHGRESFERFFLGIEKAGAEVRRSAPINDRCSEHVRSFLECYALGNPIVNDRL